MFRPKPGWTVYFENDEELKEWKSDASGRQISFSKYILEMARKGRARESSRPLAMNNEIVDLRRENAELHRKLADAQKLLNRSESDLFKIRHSSIISPGDSALYEPLVSLLEGSGLIHASELLRRLGIDPGDSQAVQIVYKHLQLLRALGLVQEEQRGWRWAKDE